MPKTEFERRAKRHKLEGERRRAEMLLSSCKALDGELRKATRACAALAHRGTTYRRRSIILARALRELREQAAVFTAQMQALAEVMALPAEVRSSFMLPAQHDTKPGAAEAAIERQEAEAEITRRAAAMSSHKANVCMECTGPLVYDDRGAHCPTCSPPEPQEDSATRLKRLRLVAKYDR